MPTGCVVLGSPASGLQQFYSMLSADKAREAARDLLCRAGAQGARVAVVYHADADGTSSAALVCFAVRALGGEVAPETPGKGDNVHGAAFGARVLATGAALAVVLDTGSRPGRLFTIPTLIVDHHRIDPAQAPEVEAFVSTLGDDPETSTSALTYELLAPVVEPLAPIAPRAWLAALGLLGDLGDGARRHPLVAAAARQHGLSALREAVALVNAAGRSAAHDAGVALEALLEAERPADLARGGGEAARRLRALKEEVSAATRRAIRVAPRVHGRWAVIQLDEPYRVHGPVASAWTRRLPDRIVLVANRGYMPGRVHFSVRSHLPLDLRAALTALLPDAGPDFAAGHDRATGGIVRAEVFDELLRRIRDEAARGAVA
ncbi:DHH family phosphoesterase [Sorangium sp. So ce1335]|uniref:DHH family phosphoesterase n=1 Tax=Sorangium sp. So ce1335 TaxID=3133335 RepID=UPI003F604F34